MKHILPFKRLITVVIIMFRMYMDGARDARSVQNVLGI